jgi:two-component system NtrC family sensor kinase
VGKLAAGLAHELGTPLNVVAGRAEMIARGDADAEQSRDYARIIIGSAKRMTGIIRQLLDFARRSGPRKEAGDVATVASHTLDLLRPLAKEQGVELLLYEDEGPHTTRLDAGQIEQVLTNLVINAVQATSGGGLVDGSVGQVDVRVTRERARPPEGNAGSEGDWIAVRVSDHGQGIAPEHLPHIFEPFFTTKEVGSGTGLGLSVAYGIIGDHDGWIDVDSKLGQGTSFALFLPVEP